ncbi:MAG: hypothetical protein AUK43_12685 [Oscillatoriales cyanobacterium CG2_30_40_61]|nr:MAG: hypothetical protein AUK43_12685 [Oscillatoriales cyanobacterium CG2_30_40_61]
MERPYLTQEIRLLVAQRADYLCEYCLISEKDTILGCAIDHIISKVTAKILGFNDQQRLLERQLLIEKKIYPSPSAMKRIKS